jgi:hypothetical protein
MTSFDQRENEYEVEFAHREELRFKVRERAVKLLALWAAERLGKTGQAGEAYAVEMVAADVASPTPDTVLGHFVSDLSGKVSGQDVRRTGSGHKRMHQYAAPLGADDFQQRAKTCLQLKSCGPLSRPSSRLRRF